MIYTLGDAAKATGKSKTTISKAIKNGKISAQKNDDGSYSIDPSELHRVYPVTSEVTVNNGQNKTPKKPEVSTNYDSDLVARLKVAEARLEDKEEIISDLRQDRDKWRQQATALLENKVETKGFWAKIFEK